MKRVGGRWVRVGEKARKRIEKRKKGPEFVELSSRREGSK